MTGHEGIETAPELASRARRLAAAYVRAAALAAAETLWPTRCAVCDVEGEVLCARCRGALPFIDQWAACPVCGAPWGAVQCTECNPQSLADAGMGALPFAGCVCAVRFDDEVARIVRVHKDGNERRLAAVMGFYIACAIPPEWVPGACVTYVPATRDARARRGFDHARAIAHEVARLLGTGESCVFAPPKTHDQRELGRAERFANMRGAFVVERPGSVAGRTVIVVDDVLTTGATLAAAAGALLEAGAREVRCAGFARVY